MLYYKYDYYKFPIDIKKFIGFFNELKKQDIGDEFSIVAQSRGQRQQRE